MMQLRRHGNVTIKARGHAILTAINASEKAKRMLDMKDCKTSVSLATEYIADSRDATQKMPVSSIEITITK